MNHDYILVHHQGYLEPSPDGKGLVFHHTHSVAVMCGSQASCKAHAIWNKIDRYEVVYAPPPPPGWTDELTGVTYS